MHARLVYRRHGRGFLRLHPNCSASEPTSRVMVFAFHGAGVNGERHVGFSVLPIGEHKPYHRSSIKSFQTHPRYYPRVWRQKSATPDLEKYQRKNREKLQKNRRKRRCRSCLPYACAVGFSGRQCHAQPLLRHSRGTGASQSRGPSETKRARRPPNPRSCIAPAN